MRLFGFNFCVVVLAVLPGIGRADPPDHLAMGDVVNHPERWPASVTLTRDYNFQGGVAAHRGDRAAVMGMDGSQIAVCDGADLQFEIPAEECGFVDAANAQWASLTPPQRALDVAALIADRSLWPEMVGLSGTLQFNNGVRLDAGKQYVLMWLDPQGVALQVPGQSAPAPADFANTDLFIRARKLLAMDRSQRPPRIADIIGNYLIDSTGRPYKDEHLADKQLFLLYFGGQRCPRCVQISPTLVSTVNQLQPQYPQLQVVMISEDGETATTIRYMAQEKMPWPAVPFDQFDRNCKIFYKYTENGGLLPEMILVDRFGTVVADSDNHRGQFDPAAFVNNLPKTLEAAKSAAP